MLYVIHKVHNCTYTYVNINIVTVPVCYNMCIQSVHVLNMQCYYYTYITRDVHTKHRTVQNIVHTFTCDIYVNKRKSTSR